MRCATKECSRQKVALGDMYWSMVNTMTESNMVKNPDGKMLKVVATTVVVSPDNSITADAM